MEAKMYKRFISMLSLVFVFAFFFSCKKSEETQISAPVKTEKKPVTISFWHAMGGEHQAIIKEFVDKFQKAYPDITVNAVYQSNYTILKQGIVTSLQSGDNPTISQMYENWITSFIENDVIIPAEDFFAGEDGFSKDDIDDIFEPFRKSCTFGGKIWTLPFNKSIYVMVYNEDHLKKAGFDHPPKTWEELREVCKKLTIKDDKGGVVRYGYALRPFVEIFSMFFYQTGGDYYSEDGKKLLFAGQEGVETLKFITDMVKDKIAYSETAYLNASFAAEKFSIFYNSSSGTPFVATSVGAKFKWRIAPMPKGKVNAVLAQGTNLGIFKNVKKEEQLAAWKFIKFLTNSENSAYWSIKTGYAPVRKSSLKTQIMQDYLKEHPDFEECYNQIQYVKFDPIFASWSKIRDLISDAVDKAIEGGTTPEDALKNVLKDAESEVFSQK